MPYIQIIDEDEATGKLQEIYKNVKEKRGKIAHIMKIHSLNPQTMEAHMALYLTLMFGPGGLKREEREMIAVMVSRLNKCDYCVIHHAEALQSYWKNQEKLQDFIGDFQSVSGPSRKVQLIRYTEKLTTAPHTVTQTDIDALHHAGFTDKDILHIALIIGYFNFVNRIALGLGVEHTPAETKGYKY